MNGMGDVTGFMGRDDLLEYESDQAKIFNRSVEEWILKRSKFMSANSVTNKRTNEQTNGKWHRKKYKEKNFCTW